MSRVLQENKLLAEQVTALDLQNKQLDKVNAGEEGLHYGCWLAACVTGLQQRC